MTGAGKKIDIRKWRPQGPPTPINRPTTHGQIWASSRFDRGPFFVSPVMQPFSKMPHLLIGPSPRASTD